MELYRANNYVLTVTIQHPFYSPLRGKQQSFQVTLDEKTFSAFRPLDRNHDCSLDLLAAHEADKQRAERDALIKYVTSIIFCRLSELITSNDPVRGYSPEELKEQTST